MTFPASATSASSPFPYPLRPLQGAGPRRRARRPRWRWRGPLLLLVFGLSLLAAGPARAQKYRTAAGLRLGKDNLGLTIQQKIFDHVTVEGLGLAAAREFSGTLLVERHFGILGPSLNYYFGAGGHVGKNQDTGAFGGLDGLVGAEYKIALTHFVISFDLKPTVEFNPGARDWSRFPSAFSVRYVFLKDRKNGVFRRLFGGGRKK